MVRHGRPQLSVRYRLGVFSRILAAVIGGYAVTALFTACLAIGLPLVVLQPRAETVLAATLPAFLILCLAAIWVFAARSARRAWLGLLAAMLLLGGVYGWLSAVSLPGDA